ncbi:MAG TPA: sulfatase-like hydrolase/transferase [Terriglobia bacterium]|nr:sulfatase-like hydrolase/transferase [Terriglobia bacterium]
MPDRLSFVSSGWDALRGTNRTLLFTLTLSFLALPCGAPPHTAQESDGPTPVILISIDTLRADHLSAYGYQKIHTPHIDSFAQGGTLFTQAETQVPLTLPSHTALFTSTYPFQNLVEENGERVLAGAVTLASVLQARGYKTAAFIGSEFLDRRYGVDQGFDEYDSPFGAEATRVENPLAMSLRRDGALVVRAARQWLDSHRGQPVFVFVHLFDLHTPYTLPPEVARRRGISRYDAQLEYVDQVMGHFQQELMAGGWWEKSVVVVFGDHGEGLGNHQEIDHGFYIYESTLHVPLIVHWPQRTETRNSKIETGNSGRVSSYEFRVSSFKEPVGLIDVAPTILDYLRVPAPVSFEGQSLLGALKAGDIAGPRAVFSESLYAHDAFRWAPLRALRVGKYKYIQAPKAELYDLDADPHERVNLLHKNAAMAAELQSELTKVLTRYAPAERAMPSGLTPETLAQLESLGYLAAEPRGKIEYSGPDPKDHFAEFALYQNAFVAFLEGNIAAALPKFQSILKSDPQNTLARFHLGECYLRTKQAQNALREWVTVLKLDPQYAPAAEAIGQYWFAEGDYAKARLRFQQVVALTPESYAGHFQLAVADEHLGLLPEARQHLEIACKIAPRDENCTLKLKSHTQK